MKTNNHLIISGITFTVILFLWPMFMAISNLHGTIEEQIMWVNNNLTLYKTSFFFAFLICPSFIYLMISQIENYIQGYTIRMKFGIIFLTAYSVLASIAYSSQIIVVPNLLKNGLIEYAKIWYFGSPSSLSYFFDELGYFMWAIGTLSIFSSFLFEKGILKYIGIIYCISAILSIVAFVGLIIDNSFPNSMTILSGLCLAPIGILTVIQGIQQKRKNN